MKKNYILWAVPKNGEKPFRSLDYNGAYIREEAERIAGEQNEREGSHILYVASSKRAVRPLPYVAPATSEKGIVNTGINIKALKTEIERLKKISERQSAMLAAALEYKNELLEKQTQADQSAFTIKALKEENASLVQRIVKAKEAVNVLRMI